MRMSQLASRYDDEEAQAGDKLDREATEPVLTTNQPVAHDPRGRSLTPTRKMIKQRTPSEEQMYREKLL